MQAAFDVPPHPAAGVQDGELLCDGGPNGRLGAPPPVTNNFRSGAGAGADALPTCDGRDDPMWLSALAAAWSPRLTPGSGGQFMTTPSPNSVGYLFRAGETPPALGGPTSELATAGTGWFYWVTPPPPQSVGGGGDARGGGAPAWVVGVGADFGAACEGSRGKGPECDAAAVSDAPDGEGWRGGGGSGGGGGGCSGSGGVSGGSGGGGDGAGSGGGLPLPSLPIPPEFEVDTLAAPLPQPVGIAVSNLPAHDDRLLMEEDDRASGGDGSDADGVASDAGSDGGGDDSDDHGASGQNDDEAASVPAGDAPAAAAAPCRPLTRGMAALERAEAVEAASNRAAKAAWKAKPNNRAAMAAARDAVRRLAAPPNGQPVDAKLLQAARLRVRQLNNQKSAAASRASQKALVMALRQELQQL